MKILPLPVKKNKFGERVADISAEKYYRQIVEEVLEAHKASIVHDIKKVMSDEGCGQCAEYVGEDNEAEELVDIITCCITRLDIVVDSKKDFVEYVSKLLTAAKRNYTEPEDFYTDLAFTVMQGFCLSSYSFYECKILSRIIVKCVKRLESMGYDESAREKIYQAVNEKNAARGYLEVSKP